MSKSGPRGKTDPAPFKEWRAKVEEVYRILHEKARKADEDGRDARN